VKFLRLSNLNNFEFLGSYLFAKFIAKDGIAIAQQVARELVNGNASRNCCPVHSAVGWELTLKWTMRRRSWANTKNT
jgi:hypothetical protein